MFAYIRKALVAGFGAGIGAAAAVLLKAGQLDSTTISQALAALIVAGVPIGWATWRTENKKTPAGS